jgi:hypothetical protein|tara:strand:- start:2947 stop:3372 length:426 start_codon:yes stop_codon:yes gene_type:complete
MDCLIKEKKDRKVIIWTLDGSPKFYHIEFKPVEIKSNYLLKIVWNRPIKGITTNTISLKLSYSDIFFEEKTTSTNQFIIESNDVIDECLKNINRKLIFQGLTSENINSKSHNNILKYLKKIIKYIRKKQNKDENRIKSKFN